MTSHDDAIREQFRLQAGTWADDRSFATAGLRPFRDPAGTRGFVHPWAAVLATR